MYVVKGRPVINLQKENPSSSVSNYDLNRSRTALDKGATFVVVVEMSQSS